MPTMPNGDDVEAMRSTAAGATATSSQQQSREPPPQQSASSPKSVDPTQPLLLLSTLALLVYLVPYKLGLTFFTLHPTAMVLAFAWAAASAVAIKRSGAEIGRTNPTKVHAWLMWVSFALTFVGAWVIYMNKEWRGKQHIKTLHALIGFAVIVSTFLHPIAAWTWLNPDTGTRRSDVTLRAWHRYLGVATILLAFAACVTGLKVEDDWLVRGGMTLILSVMLVPVLVPVKYLRRT